MAAVPKGRVAGRISLQVNGTILNAVGSFSWNLGKPKREYVLGPDGLHGFKEMPQVGYIEGEIRDNAEITFSDILGIVDGTVTITLASGKQIMCQEAVYAADGAGNTEEGSMEFRVEGDCDEVKP